MLVKNETILRHLVMPISSQLRLQKAGYVKVERFIDQVIIVPLDFFNRWLRTLTLARTHFYRVKQAQTFNPRPI